MSGVWRSLLWKEWREQRSSIAILTAFFVLIPTLFSLRTPTNYFGVYSMTLFVIPIMCLFVAMGIAAREQSSETIGFLQALPVSPRKPAVSKLLWAIVAVTTPVLVSLGVAWLVQAGLGSAALEAIDWDARIYGTEGRYWFMAKGVMPPLAAISLLLWLSAAGVNLSDEVRAGAIGLLVVVSCWGAIGFIAYALSTLKVDSAEEIVKVALAAAPGGIVALDLGMPPVGGMWKAPNYYRLLAFVMIVSHIGLAATYIGRFGRVLAGQPQNVAATVVPLAASWLAPPRRSPFAAIAWKQFRESAPLAVMGAACIALATLVVYFTTKREAAGGMTTNQLLFMAAVVWLIVGMMVAVVAGVGVFLDDLSPGLNGFWRSRPVKIGQWFIVKYLVGLLVTIVTIAVPLIGVALYVWMTPDERLVINVRDNVDARNITLLGGAGQIVVYTYAVAAIVLLRRPIHAAFTAIAATLLTWVSSALIAEIFFTSANSEEVVAFTLVGCSTLATFATLVVAWLAMKNDWGWRR